MSANNTNESSGPPPAYTPPSSRPPTYALSQAVHQNTQNPIPTRIEYARFPPALIQSSRHFTYRTYPRDDIESGLNNNGTTLANRSLEAYQTQHTSTAQTLQSRNTAVNTWSRGNAWDWLCFACFGLLMASLFSLIIYLVYQAISVSVARK